MSVTDRSIQRLSKNRAEIAKLALAAVLLASGVSLLTAPVLQPISAIGVVAAASGFILIMIVMLGLAMAAISDAGEHKHIRAILFVEGSKSHPVEVPGYKFSEEVAHYLQGLFVENTAYAKIWATPFKNSGGLEVKPDKKMVLELVEYYFLKQLSLHLSEVFESRGVGDASRISKITRGDIPQILLTNRFLESFSREMSARSAFSDHEGGIVHGNGERHEIVYAFGKGGAIFDNFRLILPKGSRVSRDSDGRLHIETAKFDLSFNAEFVGFYGSTPFGFEPLYLGVDFDGVEKRLVKADIRLRFKPASILALGDWQYFSWAESFVKKFHSGMCFDQFIEECGWNQSYTTYRVLSKSKAKWSAYEAFREERSRTPTPSRVQPTSSRRRPDKSD